MSEKKINEKKRLLSFANSTLNGIQSDGRYMALVLESYQSEDVFSTVPKYCFEMAIGMEKEYQRTIKKLENKSS